MGLDDDDDKNSDHKDDNDHDDNAEHFYPGSQLEQYHDAGNYIGDKYDDNLHQNHVDDVDDEVDDDDDDDDGYDDNDDDDEGHLNGARNHKCCSQADSNNLSIYYHCWRV